VDNMELVLEVLREADRFACEALSAYAHKISMLDTAEERFSGKLNFMDATSQMQQKIRIVCKRLEEEKGGTTKVL